MARKKLRKRSSTLDSADTTRRQLYRDNTDARKRAAKAKATGTHSTPVEIEMPPTLHTRVGNNKQMFMENVDERKAHARRFREQYLELGTHLGGIDYISAQQKIIIRRLAFLSVIAESYEYLWAIESIKFSMEQYIKVTNTLRRLAATVGLGKVARDITPKDQELSEYIRSQANGRAGGLIEEDEEE